MVQEFKPALNVFHSKELKIDPGEPRNFSPQGVKSFAVMLGSGKPEPTLFRYGPGGAIISNETPYIIDAGDGIWRAIAKAAISHDKLLADSFEPNKLKKLFITHLHSDHTAGLASFLLLPWIHGRKQSVDVFGPIGTKNLVNLLLEAYKSDINERVNGPEKKDDFGWRANVYEIMNDGPVYKDNNVEVVAFHHPHGGFKQNLGYLFKTIERSFIWAGDGIQCSSYKKIAQNVDILFSDISPPTREIGDTPWRDSEKEISRIFHMQPKNLGALATEARVKKIVLHHEQNYSNPYNPEVLVEAVKQYFQGDVVSARDADIY